MPTLSATRQSPLRPANLPVIEHPKSRLAEKNSLSVVGSSASDVVSPRSLYPRPSSVSSAGSQVDLLPALRPESCPLPRHHRMLTWPPVHEIKSGQQKPNIPKQTIISNSQRSRYNSDELYELVKESLTTGFHGVKQLFRSNDPHGSGVISRAGLGRIFYNLVGYLTVKQVHMLLKRLGWESKKTFSFDEFMSVFRDSEVVQREWMSPCTRKEVYAQRKRVHPEESLRDRTLGNCFNDGDYVLSTYANALLKDKCKRSDFNIQDHLAPSCFEKSGIILPPQLQECLASIGVLLDDHEMRKLWQRYDVQHTGILDSAWFFDQLGLDAKGRLKTKIIIPTVSSYVIDEPSVSLKNRGLKDGYFRKLQTASAKDARNERIRTADSCNQWYPHNNIMSFLFSKVEENFLAMMTACKNRDHAADGSITKEDLQVVLRQYGIPLTLIELDKLLEKSRAKRSTGSASYKDFLYMFMSRSEYGIAHKVMSNPNHRFNSGTGSSRGNLTAEDAEAKLVEVLHGCFLKLLAAFRQVDAAGIQVISKKLFQVTLEMVFNVSLTEGDLCSILLQFSLEEDGLVPYPQFLALFNKKRPRPVATDSAQSRYKRKPSPSQDMLKDEPSQGITFEAKHQGKKMETRYRSVDELSDLIQEAVGTKSYISHEAFQRLDPKATGRMTRTQMHYWLQELGLLLHPTELQNLWTSMNLSKDGMVNYAEVYDYFTSWSRCKQADVLRRRLLNSGSKFDNEPTNKREIESGNIIKKIAPKVVKNWNYIKKHLRNLDPLGITYILISDFQNLAHDLKLNLTNDELDELCGRFDVNHNGMNTCSMGARPARAILLYEALYLSLDVYSKPTCYDLKLLLLILFGLADDVPHYSSIISRFYRWLFHYLEFLQLFLSQPTVQKQSYIKYDKYTHTVATQDNDAGTTVASAMLKLRKKLLQNWKSLRRAFRKVDINNDGHLSVEEFKNVLGSLRINVNEEDLYHILSEFDENMDGKISYDEFISRLIE